MNEADERKAVQSALNRALSGLEEKPFLAQAIIAKQKGARVIVKRKLSFGLILAIVAVFAAFAALAASLVFSPRYDAKKLANQALKDQYGITDQMMTVFSCNDVADSGSGSRVFTYQAIEEPYAKQVGVYTVTVKNGKAHAVWSHDGENNPGGIQSPVWGAEQLALLCSDQYGEVMSQLHNTEADTVSPTATPPSAADSSADDSAEAQQSRWEENRAKVMAASKLSYTDATSLATAAVESEYGLTTQQGSLLETNDDINDATYRFENDQPLMDLFLHLMQNPNGSYTEKDGIYVVTVNLYDGVIENIIYDSGLASNG